MASYLIIWVILDEIHPNYFVGKKLPIICASTRQTTLFRINSNINAFIQLVNTRFEYIRVL